MRRPPTGRARRLVDAPPDNPTLAAALRARLQDRSWSAVRRLCETGKVRVGGTVEKDASLRVAPGAEITIDMAAPRPRVTVAGFRVGVEDNDLIVIEKPAGVASVPFTQKEAGTALDLIRAAWRANHRRATATPLYVVHRLDKETSGLICFAKTRKAEAGLHGIFQRHLADRVYLALVHGELASCRIESRLVPDRGDGLRGSARGNRGDAREGQHAVTLVEAVESFPVATLCRVRPQTGRTHQIRIQLAERGHPVVGDAVYTRDLWRAGARLLSSPRMMLHAETLGFDHPITAERLHFDAGAPPELKALLRELGSRA